MNIEYGVRGRFSATHSRCNRVSWPHGHRFRIEVLATGELDPQVGMIRGTETLQETLTALLETFDHQHLDDVMAGSSTSVVGIATFIQNELVARYPRITEVIVRHDDGETGRVIRTPRVL